MWSCSGWEWTAPQKRSNLQSNVTQEKMVNMLCLELTVLTYCLQLTGPLIWQDSVTTRSLAVSRTTVQRKSGTKGGKDNTAVLHLMFLCSSKRFYQKVRLVCACSGLILLIPWKWTWIKVINNQLKHTENSDSDDENSEQLQWPQQSLRQRTFSLVVWKENKGNQKKSRCGYSTR